MTDPAPEQARLDALLHQLSDALAAELGPERESVVSRHLSRLAERDRALHQPAVDQARQALQRAPGSPAALGRGRGAMAAALQQLAEEVAAHRVALDGVLTALSSTVRAVDDAKAELEGELDALHDRFTEADRRRAWTPTDLDLSTRIARLEQAQRRTELRPWYSSQRLAETVRGDSQATDERYADLADRIAAHGGPVLDLGCGSGTLLQLLAARGVATTSVDGDPESVGALRASGLDGDEGDPVAALRERDAGSLGVLVLIRVIEHLAPQQLIELIALAADKLRPGGLLVAETANPASLYAQGHALHLDPAASAPVHPRYLEFLCREAGFASVEVQLRSEPRDDEKLAPLTGTDPDLVDGVNQTITRLNELLFGPQDYAVLATR